MPLLYHAYVYLEFLILACTIYILAPGMTVSRKKSGNNIRALFDIRRKEVRNAVAHCSYLEMEIKKDRIVIRCIQETRNKIVSMEEVLKEFSISNTVLKLASGLEGQISLAEYFGTIGGFETY